METATQAPSLDLCQRCDATLGTGGILERLWWHMNRSESLPSWFRSFAEFERMATTLRVFEPLAIPGLLQTDDYARALLRVTRPDYTEGQIEELVAARMERQTILDRPRPPTLFVLMNEDVLSHAVGGTKVMSAQLDRLIEASGRPKITLQVVPASNGACAGLGGTCTVASSNGHEVLYFETFATGQLVDRAEDVEACVAVYDMLRAEALPREASLDLIRRRKEEYESHDMAQGQP